MSTHNNLYVNNALYSGTIDTTGNVTVGGTLFANGTSIDGSGNVIVSGGLTVNGTTTVVDSVNTSIADNVIILNSGETLAGVAGGAGTSGLEIERGTSTNYQLVFNEGTDRWSTGTGTTWYTDRYEIVEKGEATVTGTIPAWDANGRLVATLTAAEATQLQNIDTTTISATQWGYLGLMDQGVTTTDDVTFNNVTVTGTITGGASTVSGLITADQSITDAYTRVDDTALTVTLLLPDNATSVGKTFTIYKEAGGNTTHVQSIGSDKFHTTSSISAQMSLTDVGQFVKCTSLGNGVWIVG